VEVMLEQGDDPRAIFLAALLKWDKSIKHMIERAAHKGYAPAQAHCLHTWSAWTPSGTTARRRAGGQKNRPPREIDTRSFSWGGSCTTKTKTAPYASETDSSFSKSCRVGLSERAVCVRRIRLWSIGLGAIPLVGSCE
jgi:hypothetical protein